MKTAATILILLTAFSLNAFSQGADYTRLKGHEEPVSSVAFSPDGKILATGSADDTIKLWDPNTGKEMRTLTGHWDNVTSVAFSPDGKILASGSADDTIKLWDPNTGKEIRTLESAEETISWDPNTRKATKKLTGTGHSGDVTSVAFSPDGKILLSGGSEEIILWDFPEGSPIGTYRSSAFKRVTSVAFSEFRSDSYYLFATGDWNNKITLWFWSPNSETPLALGGRDEGAGERVNSIAFSPDGKMVAAGGWAATKLWDFSEHHPRLRHINTLRSSAFGRVKAVTFSPNGKILASGSGDETIKLWDSNTGEHLRTLSIKSLSRQPIGFLSIAFSPDGKTIAAGWGKSDIILWNIPSTDVILTPDPVVPTPVGWHRSINTRIIASEPVAVQSVAFSPDGKILASGSGSSIGLRDVGSGRLTHHRFNSGARVKSINFSPDGQTLAGGVNIEDTRGHIRLWDINTKQELKTFGSFPVNSVVFSPDGQTLAIGCNAITDTRFVHANRFRTLYLYDATTHEQLKTFETLNSVNSVAFSPDGKILASGNSLGERQGNITLWNPTTAEHMDDTDARIRVNTVVFSPDGKILAAGDGHGMGGGNRFGDIELWNVTPEGTARSLKNLKRYDGPVYTVAFSPDGKMLASGHGYGNINLWDAITGEHTDILTGHKGTVLSVAFSPDGSMLASGSTDKTIRLWEFSDTRVSIAPDPVVSAAIGEQFTIDVNIVSGKSVGGYQIRLAFDTTALRYVSSANGDYLPPGSFFVPPVASEKAVTLGATSLTGVSNGDGTLTAVTFEVVDVKESVIAIDEAILTDSAGEHLPYLANSAKVVPPSQLTSAAVVSITPTSMLSPAVGEQLTFNVDIASGQNVADFQLTLDYDASALRFLSENRGNYLADGVGNGDGILQTVTFEVLDVKASTVSVSGYLVAPNGLRYVPTFENAKVIVPLLGDVNRDGVVNILDLVQVASKFGQSVSGDPADVNEDGLVNIVDLVKVAGALGDGAAAPSAWHLSPEAIPTRTDVQTWLLQAQQLNLTDATSQRGILFLENLLAALTPKETALLPNYPNPFNPETWIPYQLAEPADVHISIYTADGKLVRTLDLGHQPIGIYQDKSRAAHWDGRNQLGESVASGVYFYTLSTESTRDSVTAGDFTATRKMLIRK